MPAELDTDVIQRVVALTKRARDAEDASRAEAARQQRASLLTETPYEARVREDDGGEWLVLYPSAWLTDGTVNLDAIDDLAAAIERPLGPRSNEAAYEAVSAANLRVAAAVRRRHGPVHGETAEALATYLSNHHLTRIENATARQLSEFLEEYLRRNAWPTDEQRRLARRTIDFASDLAKNG